MNIKQLPTLALVVLMAFAGLANAASSLHSEGTTRVTPGRSHYVEHNLYLNPSNNTLTGKVRLRNHNSVLGFRADVAVVYFDANDHLIGLSRLGRWGISEVLIFGSRTRTVLIQKKVPQDIVQHTARIGVWSYRRGTGNSQAIDELEKSLREAAKRANEIAKDPEIQKLALLLSTIAR